MCWGAGEEGSSATGRRRTDSCRCGSPGSGSRRRWRLAAPSAARSTATPSRAGARARGGRSGTGRRTAATRAGGDGVLRHRGGGGGRRARVHAHEERGDLVLGREPRRRGGGWDDSRSRAAVCGSVVRGLRPARLRAALRRLDSRYILDLERGRDLDVRLHRDTQVRRPLDTVVVHVDPGVAPHFEPAARPLGGVAERNLFGPAVDRQQPLGVAGRLLARYGEPQRDAGDLERGRRVRDDVEGLPRVLVAQADAGGDFAEQDRDCDLVPSSATLICDVLPSTVGPAAPCALNVVTDDSGAGWRSEREGNASASETDPGGARRVTRSSPCSHGSNRRSAPARSGRQARHRGFGPATLGLRRAPRPRGPAPRASRPGRASRRADRAARPAGSARRLGRGAARRARRASSRRRLGR